MNSCRYLYVDVQGSGSPGNGVLLEVAWKESGSDPHSFLVRNTSGEKIPGTVKRITGISDEDVSGTGAIHPEEVKKLFLAAAGLTGKGPKLTLVAHYSPYEKRWLEWLTGIDLDFLCTRELAMKKYPDLPSGSLRAVAGAIGFSLGEKRRALEHVLATEAVFLAIQSGYSPVSFSREERLSLPACPGVYRFLDSADEVIYVGKAKNLKNRVNSHFTGKQKGRHAELISRICGINYEETETPLHAAIMESRLINELSPQYNKAGRNYDDTLWYFPSGTNTISSESGKAGYYGPFSSTNTVAEFFELKALIEGKLNKTTFVENLWPEIDELLFKQAFTKWISEMGKEKIFAYGLKCYRNDQESEVFEAEDGLDIVDIEYVKRKLDELAISGSLLCRRAAAHRLLQGCEVQWSSTHRKSRVHKFVENSVTDFWSRSKLQTIKVLLAELRRIYREGGYLEIRTRFGTRIREIDRLFSAV